MKKKQIIMIACTVLILLLGTVYYFRFTRSGNENFYNIFGGNDLHLAADGKEVYWFDVRHSNDPSSPMFGRIENAFAKFGPDLVLVEGGYDTFEGERDTAIYEGESAFAAWLAKENEIPAEDIEPPFDKQIEYLLSKYEVNDILAMYLIRQISSEQFAPDNSKTDFNQLLLGYAEKLKANGLEHQAETAEDILKIINVFLPEQLDAGNWRDVEVEPVRNVYAREDGLLFPIYDDTYNFRNLWLLELLEEKKNTYGKIFIVMGGQHPIDTKDRLKEIY